MDPEERLSLEELQRMCENMHMLSPEELRQVHQQLLATLPPETQEVFREIEASAIARPPRPVLTDISASALLALNGEDLDLALYDYVAGKLDMDAPEAALRELPRGLQVCYMSFVVEAEVMNGGLSQFFWNSSGELAAMIAPALRELGAHEAAGLFEKALFVAEQEAPMRARLKAENTWQSFSASHEETRLDQFDQPLAELAERFPMLRAAFIRDNQDRFTSAI